MSLLDGRQIRKKLLFYAWIGLTFGITFYLILFSYSWEEDFFLCLLCQTCWHDFQCTIKWNLQEGRRRGRESLFQLILTRFLWVSSSKSRIWKFTSSKSRDSTVRSSKLPGASALRRGRGRPRSRLCFQSPCPNHCGCWPLCRPPRSKANCADKGNIYYWNVGGLYQLI